MPLFDYLCVDCGKTSEVLVAGGEDRVSCETCGSSNVRKLLSAHSSFSGSTQTRVPGPGDTSCCGASPTDAGCAGPGSCCGRHTD